LTIFLLLIAIGTLGYKARNRRGYAPLITGMIGAITLVTGKFYWDINFMSRAGIILLIAASIWNAWPQKSASAESIHLNSYDKNKH